MTFIDGAAIQSEIQGTGIDNRWRKQPHSLTYPDPGLVAPIRAGGQAQTVAAISNENAARLPPCRLNDTINRHTFVQQLHCKGVSKTCEHDSVWEFHRPS